MGFTPREAASVAVPGTSPKKTTFTRYRCCSQCVTHGHSWLTHTHTIGITCPHRDFLMSLLSTASSKSIFIPHCSATGRGRHVLTLGGTRCRGSRSVRDFKQRRRGRRCDSRCCCRVLNLPPPSCLRHKCNDLNILLHLVLFYKKDWKVKS